VLIEESIWLGQHIHGLPADELFPLCNLGSSTGYFRTMQQPHIEQYIFKEAHEKNLSVVHVDLKNAEGVDLSGNILHPEFQEILKRQNFKSVFCSNFLEHVVNPTAVCEAIWNILPPEGFIILSCPYWYPYHEDPIDTLFRPSVDQLISLFPSCKVIASHTISSPNTFWQATTYKFGVPFSRKLRLFLPFYRPYAWWKLIRHWSYSFGIHKASCIILQKQERLGNSIMTPSTITKDLSTASPC